ncbi:hypothetical protein [Sulfurimonas sp.]
MDVSSTSPDMGSVQVEALKKSIDVTERATLKVLESATEQSQQVTAQKTGVGSNLNVKG